MLSEVLLVVKGIAILVSDADPSLVPPATFLFAFGMVGLHARLGGRGGLLGTIGLLLAWVAIGASAVNLIAQVLGLTPARAPLPALFQVTYMLAFLAILVGLLVLGIAAWRAEVLSLPWRAVPLAVGVLWFPVQAVGFVAPDGVEIILSALAWMLLGYVLWSGSGAPAEQPTRVR
jgi:hypothetical protein